MKHLASITDKDITGGDALSTAKPRIAVNAMLLDNDGNIALCYYGKYNFYNLVGGGVDPGEDLTTALKRETLEETGCQCDIICEIGAIFENMGAIDFTQERYGFLARAVGERIEPQLTEEEIEWNTSVEWHPIDRALQLIYNNSIDEHPALGFLKQRDIIFLQEVLANHADKIGGRP